MEESSPSTQDTFSPPFEPPTYALSFAEDSTLKWDPPIGSPELALALSYHFPLQKNTGRKDAGCDGNLAEAAEEGHASVCI
jgi:hypothetical protein